MTAAELILAMVTLQRVGELVLSNYNTRRLLSRGATEAAPEHYPLIVALHAAWLIVLWRFGRNQPINAPALIGYLILQGFRFWVIRTLGPRWTTRIMVVPNEPLVPHGPYRYLSHPNYVVVAGEIALLPLTLNMPLAAVIFSALNGIILAIRIQAENRALARSRSPTARL